jgi:hypothetical protein
LRPEKWAGADAFGFLVAAPFLFFVGAFLGTAAFVAWPWKVARGGASVLLGEAVCAALALVIEGALMGPAYFSPRDTALAILLSPWLVLMAIWFLIGRSRRRSV